MSKSKFTEEPWIVSKHDDNGETVIRNQDEQIIVSLEPDNYFLPSQEIQANARLISQAPAMYELLSDMLIAEENDGITDEQIKQARTILAAIDGE